jgi:hypothetical protein
MFTGLPDLAYVFGYFRHSWTLRADLISDFVCRLLARLAEKGATTVVPRLRDEDADMPLRPWVDPENFNPGYLSRSLRLMPKQGDREPGPTCTSTSRSGSCSRRRTWTTARSSTAEFGTDDHGGGRRCPGRRGERRPGYRRQTMRRAVL